MGVQLGFMGVQLGGRGHRGQVAGGAGAAGRSGGCRRAVPGRAPRDAAAGLNHASSTAGERGAMPASTTRASPPPAAAAARRRAPAPARSGNQADPAPRPIDDDLGSIWASGPGGPRKLGRRWCHEVTVMRVLLRQHQLPSRPRLAVLDLHCGNARRPAHRVPKIARTEEDAVIARLGDRRPRSNRLFSGVVKPSQFLANARCGQTAGQTARGIP